MPLHFGTRRQKPPDEPTEQTGKKGPAKSSQDLLPGGLSYSAGPQIVATQEQDKVRSAPRLQDRGAFKLMEACEYLGGLSPISVRRLIARGLIKRHPALRHIIIAKVELDRFLAGSTSRNMH